jgi:hypothetical protein
MNTEAEKRSLLLEILFHVKLRRNALAKPTCKTD